MYCTFPVSPRIWALNWYWIILCTFSANVFIWCYDCTFIASLFAKLLDRTVPAFKHCAHIVQSFAPSVPEFENRTLNLRSVTLTALQSVSGHSFWTFTLRYSATVWKFLNYCAVLCTAGSNIRPFHSDCAFIWTFGAKICVLLSACAFCWIYGSTVCSLHSTCAFIICTLLSY